MIGACRGSTWRVDDFSTCFKEDYLKIIYPLVLVAISITYLTVQIILTLRSRVSHAEYKPLLHNNGRADYQYGSTETVQDDTSSGEDDFIALWRAGNTDAQIVHDHPQLEVVTVLVEEAAVLIQVFSHAYGLIKVKHMHGHKIELTTIVQMFIWAYIASLTTLRLFFSSQTKFGFRKLWYHTAVLYCLLLPISALLFRSEFYHPSAEIPRTITTIDLVINFLLVLITLTCRKGNGDVELEYEGDIEPSKEETASLLSLATYSWLDSLIIKGYKKPLEISDVWNLPVKDKAANILADYRQVKKTSILAWHLTKYFKRGLIIQASWAVLAAALGFAPTLLLKVILEYVEDPTTKARGAAWFYVSLLFFSGIIAATSSGRALWIGRKITIRLRAIIIGEIYTKALKRRIASSSTKVLLDDKKQEAEPKASWFRILCCLTTAEQDKAANNKKSDKEENNDGQVSSGAIINLMAVDSFKVSEVCAYLHFLWATAPVQFFGTIFLLYRVLGYSSFIGIVIMLLLIPVNFWIANTFAKMQTKILAATDSRIHVTNEVLSNIRIIKFFAWEQRFMSQIDEKRSKELEALRSRYIVWSFAATVWSFTPVAITFLSFLVYTRVEHKPLIPSVAFTALSLFMLLRVPLDLLADMVAHVQESKVSVDRVEEYLNEPETDKNRQLKHVKLDENGDPFIGFVNATFSWGSNMEMDSEAFKLIDLNVKFKSNCFNVIVGPTGSGKSSLLMALLGEMTLTKGQVFLTGIKSRDDLKPNFETGLIDSVAYCAQQAWLVNANIKDNIVFASPWDPQRYQLVIDACALKRDLEILDGGDKTLVGEKGVTLSGGQKQRISLARALYSSARYILLDDILSAVDAHTSKWIFENAITGPLMANRTCILVTHSVTVAVPYSDYTVVMENGRITGQGTPQVISKLGLLSEDLSQSISNSKNNSASVSRTPSNLEEKTNGNTLINGTTKVQSNQAPYVADNSVETKAQGSVQFRIMMLYFRSMGSWRYWMIASIIFVGGQLISVATNVWLREWSNAYSRYESENKSLIYPISSSSLSTKASNSYLISTWYSTSKSPIKSNITLTSAIEEVNDWYYLSVFAAIGLVFTISVFLRETVLFWGSLNASKRIHRQLLENVMRAKFRFFDSTPLGQIINRFSKDLEAIDQEVTPSAIGLLYCILSTITVIILISVITPAFLIAAIFISMLYFVTGMFYINSSRDLKRLESVHRSPLYQQFGETLAGMTTIRAYGDEQRFIRENLAKINVQSRPFIYLWAANRWLAFRIDVIGSVVSFLCGTFVLLSIGKIDPGAAGLALTYAITYTENVVWLVRLYASNEQNMNSVERVKEYLDVDQEPASIVEGNRPPSNWPSKGCVEFINYSTRYRADFDLVLKNLTFKILPGEKVGVVGRTGAGKSSMALALFRALEAEEGKIIVDDVDIGLIGLQDLRENIVMVPQDPTLFSGTIRTNLDPFGLFTDEEIFDSLRRVQLIGSPIQAANGSLGSTSTKTDVTYSSQPSSPATPVTPIQNKNIFLTLSSPIAESGSNLSQGQRQLLCLARALLKAPAVLLMDEATASIDHATDSKIQETIRQLSNTTVTIAHRLKTIVDYDKVLVLDRGEVVEWGRPIELMGKQEGTFKGMCVGSGEWDALWDIVQKAEGSRVKQNGN